MAGIRICAGYYRRYDGKVVYVVSLATDSDNGEEVVIWITYPFADVPRYYTSSKKSFCAFVEVSGERRAKYKRLTNMKISEAAIERLEDEGFRGPVRKIRPRQMEEEYDARAYQQAATYHAYARELCENYSFDLRKYRFCVNQKRYRRHYQKRFRQIERRFVFSGQCPKDRSGGLPGLLSETVCGWPVHSQVRRGPPTQPGQCGLPAEEVPLRPRPVC
ncbi:MAG: hypothetical protein ACLRNQ_09105 [Flavonifractor plautii]